MLNLKSVFRDMKFIKLYRIRFLCISGVTCFKQIEEKRTKKLSHYK